MFDKTQLLFLRDLCIKEMSRDNYIENDMVDIIMSIISWNVGKELLEYNRYVELLMERNGGVLDKDDPIAMEICNRYQKMLRE
jgi:hypothetical protein